MNLLHRFGLLVIALAVLIPMPVAGGIPLLLAAMTILVLLSIRPHLSGTLIVHPPLLGVFCCALLMLGWETFAALFHYTMRDLELIAARGVWVLLGFGYLTLLTGQGPERTARILSALLLIGCTSLLIAMAMESAFYPTYEVGRQLGTLNVPWPRATGVPQSDGKIGVYLCLAVVFFVVGFANTRRWIMLLGVIVSVAPIVFTQSRSTLLGLLLTFGFLFLYYVRTTRNVYLKCLAWVIAGLCLWQLALHFDQIFSMLKGEGVYARNVDARSEGTDHGIAMIGQAPIVGAGAEYLMLAGMHELEIHSTFLGMAVKSGLLAPLLFVGFILLSASLACDRKTRLPDNLLLVCALAAGPLSEHNLYPGYFNEHLWLIAPIALAVHHFETAPRASVLPQTTRKRLPVWRRRNTGTHRRAGRLIPLSSGSKRHPQAS